MPRGLPHGVRVAILGDSHMQALGPRLRRRLEAMGIHVTRVEARPGWSVPRYLSVGDVPQLVAGSDVVVVELGGNDASLGRTPERHAAEMRRLLAQVGQRRVVWVGPGVTAREDLEARRAPLRGAQKQVMASVGGRWVDARPMTRTQDLRADGVHFTAAGYDRWASLLAPSLVDAMRTRSKRWWLGPAALGVGLVFALGAYGWSRR